MNRGRAILPHFGREQRRLAMMLRASSRRSVAAGVGLGGIGHRLCCGPAFRARAAHGVEANERRGADLVQQAFRISSSVISRALAITEVGGDLAPPPCSSCRMTSSTLRALSCTGTGAPNRGGEARRRRRRGCGRGA